MLLQLDRASVKKMGTTSLAGSTALSMPSSNLNKQRGTAWGRRQSRWLRTADGFAVCAFGATFVRGF